MKILVTCLLLLCSCFTTAAASQLEMTAYRKEGRQLKSQDLSPPLTVYITLIVIKNNGDNEVILPKEHIGPGSVQDSGRTTVRFSVSPPEIVNGAKIKPSYYEFLPVKLKQGEALEFYYNLMLPAGISVENVTYEYNISPEASKEWGFIQAKLVSRLTKERP